MDLSIIIVNYNVKYFLEQCLYSVLKACATIEAEIFVVDNNSTDGSRVYLSSKFPSVIFKWQQTNIGFGKANNSVLREATGGHILFLNPDTIVPEDCFEKCFNFFRSNENCGALGVKMLDGSGVFLKESKRSFPSVTTSFCKMSGLTALFPTSKLLAKYYAGHLPNNANHEVDVLAGAFMMLSKKAIEKVKGFDEDFFMYGEDIDLSYRIQKAGLKNYYFSEISIIHFKGESTQKRSPEYIDRFYDAMQLFISKHYKAQKATFFFMKIAIGTSRLIATSALFFKKITDKNNSAPKSLNTAVVASQQVFDNILHLLKYAKTPVTISGRITINKMDQGIAIGVEDSMELTIKKYQLKQLLFCEGDLSFKTIIQRTEQLAWKVNFLFHANNSESIVGSNSKNEKGIFIAET